MVHNTLSEHFQRIATFEGADELSAAVAFRNRDEIACHPLE